MIALLVKLALVALALRLVLGKWPWEYLQTRSTRAQAVLRARKLLGTRTDASREEVLEAHKRLIATVHPDRGGTNDQVHEANAARDLLLDELPRIV